jgi:CheY-like chemotaxis protein
MARRLGVEVDEVADGASALERIARGGVDLVLMDCQMPDQDGASVTAELRLREGNSRHLPVIGLSAATTPSDRERCRQAGMDGFLPKPLRLDQLAIELAKVLPIIGASSVGDTPIPIGSYAGPSAGQTSTALANAAAPNAGLPAASLPSKPRASLPLVDPLVLRTLRYLDADPGTFNKVVDTYLGEASEIIASIVFDGVSARRAGLGQRAHGMKGAALTIGLTRLAKALDDFEVLSLTSDDQGLADAATGLEQIFADSIAALRRERELLTSPGAT